MTELAEQTTQQPTTPETQQPTTPDPTAQNLNFLQSFINENQQVEGESPDITSVLADEVTKMRMREMETQAVDEMMAQNPHMTKTQAQSVLEAMRAGDFGKVGSIYEEANKRKSEMQQADRDKENKETETEGSSRGQVPPQGKPKSRAEAKRRALARLRGQ